MGLLESIFNNDEPKMFQTYDDISLMSEEISDIESRSSADLDPSIEAFGAKFTIPLVASPMPDVCDGSMARALASVGLMALIHRFQTVDEQVTQYQHATLGLTQDQVARIGCAVGISGDYEERFLKLQTAGCSIFCIDTANGANIRVGKAIQRLRELQTKQTYIIAGNVFSRAGFEYLTEEGADGIRVGIAGGSACTTKTETGMYVPMATCIEFLAEARMRIAEKRMPIKAEDAKTDEAKEQYQATVQQLTKDLPLIIADGGIREPRDMCKALVLGADMVMGGSIFASTVESPGEITTDPVDPGKRFKTYRGAASFSVQLQHTGKPPKYNEGTGRNIPITGTVAELLQRYEGGLRSSMSYANAHDLEEYRLNVLVIDL